MNVGNISMAGATSYIAFTSKVNQSNKAYESAVNKNEDIEKNHTETNACTAKMETVREVLKAAGDNNEWLGFNRLFDSNFRKSTEF